MKKIYRSVEGLHGDLDVWLVKYNQRRGHRSSAATGRLRTRPSDLTLGPPRNRPVGAPPSPVWCVALPEVEYKSCVRNRDRVRNGDAEPITRPPGSIA